MTDTNQLDAIAQARAETAARQLAQRQREEAERTRLRTWAANLIAALPPGYTSPSMLEGPDSALVKRMQIRGRDLEEADRPRDDDRLVVRVELADDKMAGGCSLDIHFCPAGPGWHYFEIYSGDLAHLLGLVRDERRARRIALAKEVAAGAFEVWIAGELEGTAPNARAAKEAQLRTPPIAGSSWPRACAWPTLLPTVDPTDDWRGIGVLAALEIVERLPPPETTKTIARDSNRELVAAMTSALRSNGGDQAELEQLRAEVAELRALFKKAKA